VHNLDSDWKFYLEYCLDIKNNLGDSMKAIVEIQFLNINGTPVTNDLLRKVPQLIQSTEKTMQIMIEKLEQYFRESKIQVKATYKIR
jgi:hypothetical protein